MSIAFKKVLNYNKSSNFCENVKLFKTSSIPKVSLVQRPGDSYKRIITLIPGEGIGKELASNLFVLFF